MQITQEKLSNYADFVAANSVGGVYSPEKGLESLLSALTPDPKVATLWVMGDRRVYSTNRDLYKGIMKSLEGIGLSHGVFPISERGAWNYCEREQDGDIVRGSLVESGFVEQLVFENGSHGYRITNAGVDLALPLGLAAIDFVSQVRETKMGHKYESMWRVLGQINSVSGKTRQIAIYKVIKFLVGHGEPCSVLEIQKGIEGVGPRTVFYVASSLGDSGIINHWSPSRDVNGKRAKGWAAYHLVDRSKLDTDLDALAREVAKGVSFRARKMVLRVLDYAKENPDAQYETHGLAEKLGMNQLRVSNVLSALAKNGVLERANGLNGDTKAIAVANDITRMLYYKVLEPAFDAASTLATFYTPAMDAHKLESFLLNYEEERSHVGKQGGEEVREAILKILDRGETAKLSRITEQGNVQMGRELTRSAFLNQLRIMISEGLFKKLREGMYLRV